MMEVITPEMLIMIIAVPVANWIVQFAKAKLNLSGEVALVIVCLILALGYTAYTSYASPDFIEQVHEFMTTTFMYAVLLYELVIKKVLAARK